MLDPLWIIAAFIFGAAVSRIGLPPLVGYLIAGFFLNSFGVEGGDICSILVLSCRNDMHGLSAMQRFSRRNFKSVSS
jgi:Kef-type K+ transport system membrane component KefB